MVASPLARKPYDFRHAGVSWRLNAGAPGPQVAEWAGHSVEVLYRIYAHCIDGDDEWCTSGWRTSLASPESGPVSRALLFSGAELGRCRQLHSAYIPGLATSGGFSRHMVA